MERILIIKLSALGDFVIAVGTMRYIAAKHPGAHFTLMTMKPYVPIAEQMGIFSDYILDTRKSRDSFKNIRAIARGNFDRIYDMQSNDRTNMYRVMLRLISPARSWIWIDCLPNARTMSDCTSYTVRKRCRLGIGSQSIEPYEIARTMSDLSFLHGDGKHFGMLPERYVLLIPGCSPQHPYKRWPVENYRALVRRLAERGIDAVVIGTKAEEAEINGICEGNPTAVNMMGLTGLLDVPQIAMRSLAAVGNDTGPSHMASYSKTFTIAIYDNRTRNSVLSSPNSRCFVSPSTIDLITVDQVWEALEPHLG